MFESAPELRNPYAVLVVHPRRHPRVNVAGARRWAAFLREKETCGLIATFGRARFGQALFHLYPEPRSLPRQQSRGKASTPAPLP